MTRSDLCDYSYAYILANETITITGAADDGNTKRTDKRNKEVLFKNCAPYTNCIICINIMQINNAEYIDVVMPMYNLIEYSDNYSKKIQKYVATLQG